MSKKNVVICGTHFTPALAVMEKLVEENRYQTFYIGRKHPLGSDEAISLEYKTLKRLGVPFYSSFFPRMKITSIFDLIKILFTVPLSIIQSFYILGKIRPLLILSFGGYTAVPVCFVGFLMGIPIITHEQTHKIGQANKIISKFAKKICLSWADTQKTDQEKKYILTGNPLRKSIIKQLTKHQIKNDSEIPLIYICGGSLGSHSINTVVGQTIREIISKYRVFHQCGSSNNHYDYQDLSKIKKSLPKALQDRYQIVETVDPASVGEIYGKSSLMIGRSGANTVTELMAVGLPSILIPMPWAEGNEQEENAIAMKKVGMAVIIKQDDLSADLLWASLLQVMGNLEEYNKNSSKTKNMITLDAADRIVELINKFTHE